jgi:hypothetical protein
LIGSLPIMLANLVTLGLAASVLWLKVTHRE